MFFSFLEQKEQKRTKKNKKELKRTKKKGGRFGGTSGPMGPIHIINLICVISLFICYWLSPTTMVAISATILAGGQARFQLNLEVNINILISTLMIWTYKTVWLWPWKNYVQAQGRPPLGRREFIKSMPPQGLLASPPWWWCLLGNLCFLCGF